MNTPHVDWQAMRAFVEALWAEAGVDAAFQAYLKERCFPAGAGPQEFSTAARLPRIFCNLNDGDERQVNPVVSAWLILRHAARILDDVEDAHFQGTDREKALALNGSTGLIFSALQLLERLDRFGIGAEAAAALRREFGRVALQTCSGQHRDLAQERPLLEACWEIAHAKSGAFIGLLCWAGGRLSAAPEEKLAAYRQFGVILGVLDQIRDDLADIWPTEAATSDLQRRRSCSLPVAYAFSTLPEAEQATLYTLLQQASCSEEAEREAVRMIVESGAGVYLTVQSTVYRRNGLVLLQNMMLPPDVYTTLAAHLNRETFLAQHL